MHFPPHFHSCLVAAALGDALGAPVEFMSIGEIQARYGEKGLRELVPAFGFKGAVTDDTQMAIATAKAIITAHESEQGLIDCLRDAYLEWLKSQNDPANRRAPGNTCLSALKKQRVNPTPTADNDSWGCGGVMRAHPVGLAFSGDPQMAFEIGYFSAALTHGHPRATLPAGMFAAIIAKLLLGTDIEDAVAESMRLVRDYGNQEDTLDEVREALDTAGSEVEKTLSEIQQAVYAAESNVTDLGYIESTEGGWRGDTALAIGIFCCIRHEDDPLEALFASINHSGDSDSTGTICGAMLGTMYDLDWIPPDWLDVLEHREELMSLAAKLIKGPAL